LTLLITTRICNPTQNGTLSFILLFLTFASHAAEVIVCPQKLKVLTFNTWMLSLPFNAGAHDLQERLDIFPDRLSETGADIIGLQEVWWDKARKTLKKEMFKRGYYYSFFKQFKGTVRGTMGNGLVIFSKFKIDLDQSSVMKFQDYTRKDEYFTYKGVQHAVIDIPCLGEIDFFNTHLGAISDPKKDSKNKYVYDEDEIKVHQEQKHELINFLESEAHSDVAILTSDLNSHPVDHNSGIESPTHRSLNENFIDTFHQFNSMSSISFDNKNPYVSSGYFATAPSEYLDYIWLKRNQEKLHAIKSEIVFDNLKTLKSKHFLSDHYGVLTTFELN